MAYPTNSLSLVLEDIDRRMAATKTRAQSVHDKLNAGDVFAATIIDTYIHLVEEKTALQAAAATPGIVAYAKDVKNDAGLDVVAEFNAVIAAIDSTTSWITTNFPADGSGYLLREKWSATGTSERTFTKPQTAGLRTELTALIATIA